MTLQAGTILKSTRLLNNTYFESTSIVIAEHNDSDTTGFIINRPYRRNLNQLQEFRSTAFPLFEGGPVDHEHLFFIHSKKDWINGGISIKDDIYFGGNFSQAISCINDKSITQKDIKIFVGYCGWDTPQLQEEVDEGSWIIADEDIFSVR
jgi:putative transcriptional regulator